MNIIIDTERVITEVRLRPNLWDLSNVLYKERDARNAAWLEVCQALNSNYDQLSVLQQKEYEKAVQQRWKTARDAYTKCRANLKFVKSGSGGSCKKKYIFYDYMTFLEKPHTATATEDSITQESTIHDSPGPSSLPAPSPLSAPDTPLSNDTEGENDNSQKENIKRTRKRKLKDDTKFDKEILKMLKETSNNAKDDNLTFFMSILPILNNFSDYQKLLFRSEVLRVAMDVRKMSPAVSQTEPSVSGSSYHSHTSPQIIEEQETQVFEIQSYHSHTSPQIIEEQETEVIEIQHSEYLQVQPSSNYQQSSPYYQQPSTSEADNNIINTSAIYYEQPSTSRVNSNATNKMLSEKQKTDLKNYVIFKKH